MNDISIAIVEDEAIIAEDIREILEEEGYIISGVYFNAGSALIGIQKSPPDLLLLDVNLGDELSGVDIATFIQIKKLNIPYIYLTSYSDKTTLNKVAGTRPMAYIVKPFIRQQLLSSITLSLASSSPIKAGQKLGLDKLNDQLRQKVTEREWDVLIHVLEGKLNQQIALAEEMSINTVKFHIKNIYEKLAVHTRSELLIRIAKVI